VITRIEIDGFKSFVDFKLDVPPFLVVMGGNAGSLRTVADPVGGGGLPRAEVRQLLSTVRPLEQLR
jgi:hypothetical protein